MRHLLIFVLLLWAGAVLAQGNLPVSLASRPIQLFPSSPASLTGTISGSPVSLSVVSYYQAGGRVLPPADQPTLTRSGASYSINWTAAQTARQPGEIWLELRAEQTVVRADKIQFVRASQPVSSTLALAPVNVSNLTGADLVPLSNSIAAVNAVLPVKLDASVHTSFVSQYNIDKTNTMLSISQKANASDVYTKAQIDAKKVDTYEVNTIAEARALTVPGKSADFIIKSHPPYGQTRAYWNGTKFFISPLLEIADQ
ncbi:hypothetical protein GGR92_005207 [Spirosoma lacussanchae]|uniref:hypothetical protein n=1 Tax=Spirosoma lacussanchae TaxID=1884249 RepID=UPI0011091932|nr:hypothetical protein [Spirosoma lacussanchae]